MYIRTTQSNHPKLKNSSSICFLLLACMVLISSNTFAQSNIYNTASTDTLIYKASAYVIQPDDKLDNLLTRLPQITIDNKGKLHAQGDTVQSLLVDGAEYFSDDPVSAAHFLRADKVDRIKIYWRWSDQASFTGVEDRSKIKTINVILKKQ